MSISAMVAAILSVPLSNFVGSKFVEPKFVMLEFRRSEVQIE